MNKNILRIITLPERLRNICLYAKYKFDRWHISPSINRIYPNDIVQFINRLDNKSNICEIGCGLGDTISKVNADYKLGLDCDRRVLNAAKWIHRKKSHLEFKYFLFPQMKLTGIYDIVIAVNWLHNFENETIRINFLEIFNSNVSENGLLIIDSIDNPKYRFNHNFEKYFATTKSEVRVLGKYQSNRKVLYIKKLQNED